MTENGKKFLERASKDAALKAELEAEIQKAQAEAAKKIAASHGFNLADEDLKPGDPKKLSDDELKAVAGGNTCACAIAGAGVGEVNCACGIFGAGAPSKSCHHGHCACAGGGYGVSTD